MPMKRSGDVNIRGIFQKEQVHAAYSLPNAYPALPHKK